MFKKNSIILIVEDSRSSRDQLRADLKELGYLNVLEAENGLQGILRIVSAEKSAAPVNLIISDWMMPVMNGLEFLQKVRCMKHLTQLPFIALTSNDDVNEVIKAVNAGANSYLLKPYDLNSLRQALETVFKRQKLKF